LATIPVDFFVSYLDSRKGWLEGICITGGEPLLDDSVEVLFRLIKERNLLVKVDTNGSRPDRLEELIEARLVDQVAMDVKAPLARYREVTRSEVDAGEIVRSTEILRASGLAHMFRTTLVPGLVEEKDLLEIAQMLHGAKLFQVQQFSGNNTIDEKYLELQPFAPEEIRRMADLVRPYFAEVRVEGI
jgi:pyruvate formate lyase activating enzyme